VKDAGPIGNMEGLESSKLSIAPTAAKHQRIMSIESVPTVDISPLFLKKSAEGKSDPGESSEEWECIQKISHACREWGFFYIKNHPISPETIQSFRSNMDTFFKLPKASLDPIRRTQQNSRGYYDDELTKGKLDWKRGYDFGAQDGSLDHEGLDGYNQWPSQEEQHPTNTLKSKNGAKTKKQNKIKRICDEWTW